MWPWANFTLILCGVERRHDLSRAAQKRLRMNEPYLNITPLGGLGEIGLNCQLWDTSGGVVMVD